MLHMLGAVIVVLYVMKDSIQFAIIRAVLELVQMLAKVKIHGFLKKGKVWSFADLIESRVDRNPHVVQVITAEDGELTTLGMMEKLANQFANWAKDDLQLQQKNTVCLMMYNKPGFISFWLGMSKIGVSTALLNTNITGKPFLHSVRVSVENSEKKIVVIDDELEKTLSSEIKELQREGVSVFVWSQLCHSVASMSSARPPKSCRNQVLESDPIIYIFTSGTTGLPKAAKISSTRFYMMTLPATHMAYLGVGERIYCCLPLYHSAGGLLGAGSALVNGATLVLRKKFSVSKFTDDCLRYRCTSMQYIGELCRFLLNAPPNPNDSKLCLKYAFGNGMRGDIWEPFRQRYSIGRIAEFYSATEANVALFNSTGKVGSLGCVPRILDILYPVKILRVDPEDREKPYRHPKTGRCVSAQPGETGLVVCAIDNRNPVSRFDGYSDKTATSKKVLHDVFAKGDSYFNSGDLLYRDAFGFFYWADRVGDTFRWKGENVATTEVEHVLGAVSFISDLSVYGVPVQGCDGKAGMVAIKLKDGASLDSLNWQEFHNECLTNLPVYARPLFIRIQFGEMKMTATFKHQKNVLVKDGFDPACMGDDVLLFYSSRDGKVTHLDGQMYADINNGVIRV